MTAGRTNSCYPILKQRMAGEKLSYEEVRFETSPYLVGLDKSHYSEGIKELEHHWTKCLIVTED